MSEGESASLQVIEEVAAREGIDPTELNPPLHTAIDPEALEVLFQSTPRTTRAMSAVEFQYRGYKTRVERSGEVQIGDDLLHGST